MGFCLFFFFKQKTAYEMRISDWSSDVCSSDLYRDTPSAHIPVVQHNVRWIMRHTLVAAFATLTDANRTRGDLMSRGIAREQIHAIDRKSVVWGKSVSVRVDLGGRRHIKKKNMSHHRTNTSHFKTNNYKK